MESPIIRNSKDPEYNSETMHKFRIDTDFDRSLENEVIKVDVWGMQVPDGMAPENPLLVSSSTHSRRMTLGNEGPIRGGIQQPATGNKPQWPAPSRAKIPT